jgi:hypothetical protein
MAIQKKYLNELERNLRVHERLMALAESEEECNLHEALVHLGRNPRVLEALGEVEEYPESLRSLERMGPRAYAELKGIYIPPKTDVVFARKGESWFIGFRTSSGKLWGYEGGGGGRGWVKGEDEEEEGENGGENGGNGSETPK